MAQVSDQIILSTFSTKGPHIPSPQIISPSGLCNLMRNFHSEVQLRHDLRDFLLRTDFRN